MLAICDTSSPFIQYPLEQTHVTPLSQDLLLGDQELTGEAEELLCVRGQVGGDVHGGGLPGEERVEGGRSGRGEGCRGQWRRLILDVGQLALPGVPDLGFALPLCGVDQEEGFHRWLEN